MASGTKKIPVYPMFYLLKGDYSFHKGLKHSHEPGAVRVYCFHREKFISPAQSSAVEGIAAVEVGTTRFLEVSQKPVLQNAQRPVFPYLACVSLAALSASRCWKPSGRFPRQGGPVWTLIYDP